MIERMRFVARVNEAEESFTKICESFGISRKTGYELLKRYEAEGPRGLEERSSRPHTSPQACPSALVDAVVNLRKEHPTWGPKKLRARLLELSPSQPAPAASTIGDWLHKYGLIRPRRRRVFPPSQPSRILEAMNPNDTWCADFKGHAALGDGTRCYPLTITDQVTRYLIKCEGLARSDEKAVKPHFERAFAEFGRPHRIRTDNGPPFATLGAGGLSALSVWWIKLGIVPERIDPGAPQQNGRHERMHRTLKEETMVKLANTKLEQQRAFDSFRHVYNDERPHEALGQKPPAKFYCASNRNGTPAAVEYGSGIDVRKLKSDGRLAFRAGPRQKQVRLPIASVLAREHVGVELIGEDRWRILFGPVLLGYIEITAQRPVFRAVR